VEWIFRTWTLMFWLPLIASVAAGWFALDRGIVARPVPLVLWCLTALLLQSASGLLSVAWTAGLVAQSALAIYLSIRLKLDA
jgi:surface polysaccharide O-acyltransferase-like enzyme